MAMKSKAIIPIGIGVVALAALALFATGASAEEFDPAEEDDDPEIDPDAKEEIPPAEEVEKIAEETGVDLGEGGDGWTDQKVNDFLGNLGYKGTLGARVRQFQRDCRVNPLKSELLDTPEVSISLENGMSKVDGDIGPKTVEQLNRVGVMAAALRWNPGRFLFKGGEAKFFEALKDLGYTVTRRPEQATKEFQRDLNTALNLGVRTDGHVDGPTLSGLAIALTMNSQGDWIK
jgi:hypothetical protein